MPTHKPITVYPFAVHFLILFGMIYIICRTDITAYNSRISVSFVIIGAFLLIMPFIADSGDTLGFWIVFLALLIFGWFTGIAQATIFGLAGTMPFKYMAAVMLGNGISGIASNILRAITLVAFPGGDAEDAKKSAILFFSISALFVFICASMYSLVLKNNEFFKFYLNEIAESNQLDENDHSSNNPIMRVDNVERSSETREATIKQEDLTIRSVGEFWQAIKRQFSKT